ncbi:MAG: hypothetical protein NUV65_01135 [Candidatus Roizmanbacteria bacterium]|nr:hypothetical protein [Candidatus Roizmanbacteria bacterium]
MSENHMSIPESARRTQMAVSIWYPRDEAVVQLYNIKRSRGLSFDQVIQYCAHSLSSIASVAPRWGLEMPDVPLLQVDNPSSDLFIDVEAFLTRTVDDSPHYLQDKKIKQQLNSAVHTLTQILQEISTPDELDMRLQDIINKLDARDIQLSESDIVLQVLSAQMYNRIITQRELGEIFGMHPSWVSKIIQWAERRSQFPEPVAYRVAVGPKIEEE